ncbi:hypothetical protein [Photobacterium sp. 1_MG-2023]|uniref:hypothetical protein n=1 Tax=Photobacterium sp. 1_MG-2023 TaxID=3062646 RepID=UPI0026E16E85|nr:hypothetical protein [Photobacterium sp. 1_MG-2023]MDO6706172.1 hypothetical protein [Photobacterium sp. 1_MG-2023]
MNLNKKLTMDDIFKQFKETNIDEECIFSFDKITCAFLKRNPLVTDELIPKIASSFNCNKFQLSILNILNAERDSQKKKLLEKIQNLEISNHGCDNYKYEFNSIEKQEIRTFNDVLNYYYEKLELDPEKLNRYSEYYLSIHKKEDREYIISNYIYLEIGRLLYDNYMTKDESTTHLSNILSNKNKSYVYNEYQKIGIDLNHTDSQFSKYNLLSLNNNIEIHNNKESRTLFDKRIGMYFEIKIPKKVLTSIKVLIDSELISDISFNIISVTDSIPALEEIEFGSPLNFEVSDLPKISKFYSVDNFGDNLWVHHNKEKKSLTFEEILEDFHSADDKVVTQVVHLEYFELNEEIFINHLDHEYIAYSFDEYIDKLTSPNKKGNKKVKLFKIDNARIPFHIKFNGEYFLFQVLDSILKKNELVSEYFSKV